MNKAAKTYDEFVALPVHDPFGALVEKQADGSTITIPVVNPISAAYFEEDDILFCFIEGERW